MGKDLKRIEDALRKMRIDFPSALQSNFRAGGILQEILNAEKKQEEFNALYRMLSSGVRPLIEENMHILKDSALQYYKTHLSLGKLEEAFSEIEKHISQLFILIKTEKVEEKIEELKKDVAAAEEERRVQRKKETLAAETLSVKDLYLGRVEMMNKLLPYVHPLTVRKEIKKRAEEEVYRIRHEIEKKLELCLNKGEDMSQVEVTVLGYVSGSFLSVLYQALQTALINLINVTTRSIRHKQDKYSMQEKREALEEALFEFTEGIDFLMKRVLSLVDKSKNNGLSSSQQPFSFSPSLYVEIDFVEEADARSSTINLPHTEEDVTEQNVFSLFLEWSKQFLRMLAAPQEEKPENAISLSTLECTSEANKLYMRMFIEKYGSEQDQVFVKRKDPAPSLMHAKKVTGEENILTVHGAFLVVADIARRNIAHKLPNQGAEIEDLQKDATTMCFEKKKSALIAEIKKATAHALSDSRIFFLTKYITHMEEIARKSAAFLSHSTAGMHPFFSEFLYDLAGSLDSSLNAVLRSVIKIPDGEMQNITFSPKTIVEDILRWCHPVKKSSLGSSLFLSASSSFFSDISAFLMLKDVYIPLFNGQDGNEEDKKKIENIFSITAGYFVLHMLLLARTTLDKMVQSGEVAERRLLHFLSIKNVLSREAAYPLQVYMCMHLFLNIEKCMLVYKRPAFRQELFSLQERLNSFIPGRLDSLLYSPEYIIYALEGIERKDKIYISSLLKMFGENSQISKKIQEYVEQYQKHPSNA